MHILTLQGYKIRQFCFEVFYYEEGDWEKLVVFKKVGNPENRRKTYFQILASWYSPVLATNRLTQNKFQFLGIITSEYLDHIIPGKK